MNKLHQITTKEVNVVSWMWSMSSKTLNQLMGRTPLEVGWLKVAMKLSCRLQEASS